MFIFLQSPMIHSNALTLLVCQRRSVVANNCVLIIPNNSLLGISRTWSYSGKRLIKHKLFVFVTVPMGYTSNIFDNQLEKNCKN